MAGGPSRRTEKIVGWLLPPACREHVLGDFRERYRSALHYQADVLFAGLAVISSQIRRTSDPLVRFMEAIVLYGAFVTAFAAGAGLTSRSLLCAAIPALATLWVVTLADAYADPSLHPPQRPLYGVIGGLGLAYFVQSVLVLAAPSAALPHAVMAWGCGFSLLLLATLRMIFRPYHDRPRAAAGPSYWQRLEIAGFDMRIVRVVLVVVLTLALGAFTGGLAATALVVGRLLVVVISLLVVFVLF